jgi:hypothetical protein
MRARDIAIFKMPVPIKVNPDTCPLAKPTYEYANCDPGTRLGVLVEDGGVGVEPHTLGLA